MAKSNPKKAKAKSGTKGAAKRQSKKQQEEAAVLAELELRDEDLDKVSGGATLDSSLGTTQLSTTTTTTVKNPTATKTVTGQINDLMDALNLGLY